MLLAHRTRILDQAAKRRLPTASTSKEFVQAGGLVSYGVNRPEMFRQIRPICRQDPPRH